MSNKKIGPQPERPESEFEQPGAAEERQARLAADALRRDSTAPTRGGRQARVGQSYPQELAFAEIYPLSREASQQSPNSTTLERQTKGITLLTPVETVVERNDGKPRPKGSWINFRLPEADAKTDEIHTFADDKGRATKLVCQYERWQIVLSRDSQQGRGRSVF